MKAKNNKLIMIAAVIGIALFIVNAIFLVNKIIFVKYKNNVEGTPMEGKKMKMTDFDIVKAKEFMDKNNDGKCDVCGMEIEQCIRSGMMQCTMDSDATIGILGSEHIHTDWKIYINGKALEHNFFLEKAMKSSFIHVDPSQYDTVQGNVEKTGDVLHMHTSGVPLSLFFESVGINFDKNCINLTENEKYCNDGKNSLKFYVNKGKNEEYERYVFSDGDKILISYGPVNEDISHQFSSITNFAVLH